MAETSSGGGRPALLETLPVCICRVEKHLWCGTHAVRWETIIKSFHIFPVLTFLRDYIRHSFYKKYCVLLYSDFLFLSGFMFYCISISTVLFHFQGNMSFWQSFLIWVGEWVTLPSRPTFPAVWSLSCPGSPFGSTKMQSQPAHL